MLVAPRQIFCGASDDNNVYDNNDDNDDDDDGDHEDWTPLKRTHKRQRRGSISTSQIWQKNHVPFTY